MKSYSVHGTVQLHILANSVEEAEMKARRKFEKSGLGVLITATRIEPVAPDFWRVGMLVEYVRSAEWAWSTGMLGVVHEVKDPKIPGHEYQVFYVHPLHMRGPKTGEPDTQCSWWTTPQDVRYIEEVEGQ